MAKRYAISTEVYISRHPGDIVDNFVGCYDSPEDAIANAKKYSLVHDQCEVTIFEAIQTVKAEIPATVTEIE